MKMIKTIALLFLLIPHLVYGGDTVYQWPDLSDTKFVSGRVAAEKDINDGAAVFLLQSEGKSIGVPIDIDIPQYAIHTDMDTGERSRVIVIQAEEANDQKVIGAVIIATSEYMVGLLNEFKLLGRSKPNE